MIWVDYVLIAIIVLSALFGLFRGIVREILSLVGWALSFWIALKFSHNLNSVFDGIIASEGLLYGVSFVTLLIISLIACAIVNYAISKFVNLSGIGFIDRGIGALFGVFRGLLIATVLVFFGNMTPLSAGQLWSQSRLIGPFNEIATWATDFRSVDTDRVLPEVEER